MNKEVVIHYVPKTTTRDEIKAIREHYKECNVRVIIVVSGDGNIMDNLKYFIKARKI